MEPSLKHTVKRYLPYLIGGTITGIIITYYYGFLFSIIVNSVAWFIISTVVNKYYWNYTGFRDEMFFVSKYITHRKKNGSKDSHDDIKARDNKRVAGSDSKMDYNPKNLGDDKTDHIGSPFN
jgi:hypothetical protein